MYVNIWLIDVEIKLERKYVWFTMIQTTFNAAVTDRHTQLFLIIVNFTIFAAIEMYLASPQCYSWVWNNTDNISHTQLFFVDLAGRLLVCN